MKLAILGDLHYYRPVNETTNRSHLLFFKNVLQEFFRDNYDYYISLGDMTHFGTKEEFNEIYSIVELFDASGKFQQILGNHDAITHTKEELTNKLGYPLYRSVEGKEAKLIFLDTTLEQSPENWSGVIDQEQLDWLEKEVITSGTKPVLIFSHHPIYNTTAHSEEEWMFIQNSKEVARIIKQKEGAGIFFNGHNHINSIVDIDNWYFVQSAALFCSLSFREVEITSDTIAINTISIKSDHLDEYRHHTASQLQNFTIIPADLADGKKGDHELELFIKKVRTK